MYVLRSFELIIIIKKKNNELEELFIRRRILRNKKDGNSFQCLNEVKNKLAEICALDNKKT